MYSVLESFCPQAGLALPFPIDEKEAIPRPRDVKTNPPPGVLTAHTLALIKGRCQIRRLMYKPDFVFLSAVMLSRLRMKSVKKHKEGTFPQKNIT
jgi:hypothetical protein